MRKLSFAILTLACLAVPSAAKAGFILEASLGQGIQVKPTINKKFGPTNVLIAPGYGLGEMLRAELGFVFDTPKDGESANLRLRPMLVIDPPVIPLYGRLIVGVNKPFDGDKRAYEFGGALGVGGSIAGIGLFGEVGAVPQALDGDFIWFVEGRLGAFYAF